MEYPFYSAETTLGNPHFLRHYPSALKIIPIGVFTRKEFEMRSWTRTPQLKLHSGSSMRI